MAKLAHRTGKVKIYTMPKVKQRGLIVGQEFNVNFHKEEVKYFLGEKDYKLFFTLPARFINNRKLLSLYKKFNDLSFVICFCHKAKHNSFFHLCILSGNVEEKVKVICDKYINRIKDLTISINKITGFYV